jgi:hypothetical protein
MTRCELRKRACSWSAANTSFTVSSRIMVICHTHGMEMTKQNNNRRCDSCSA